MMDVVSCFRKRQTWVCASALVAVAGCGGGQQGGGSATGTLHTSKAGDAVVTFFGQPKPQITTGSGSVGVVGQAGATFSSVILEPPPNLDDTYFVFSRLLDSEFVIYKLPYSGGPAQLIYQNNNSGQGPAASAYGTIAFYNNNDQLFTIRPDGTGLKALTFNGQSTMFGPAYSMDGTNRLAFMSGTEDLFIGPGTGGTPTIVQTNGYIYPAAWNPAGTELAYAGFVSFAKSDIYETSTLGGTANDVTPSSLQGTTMQTYVSWNADGVTLAVASEVSGPVFQIIKFNVTDPNSYSTLTPAGDSDNFPSFSPDGSKLAFYRSNANGATPGIYVSDAAGGNQSLLLADPPGETSLVNSLCWSPFLPKETVVAASASTFYHQACSGFLLSQVNDQFGSVIAFTANTPADAAIQAPAQGNGNQPMLFTLTADSITQIGYMNSYFSPGTIITLTATPSAVVSIDAVTGQVDLVAPAAIAKPKSLQNSDGTVTYNCKFKAIYDGKGKNLAPSGAGQLVVNPKTGKLVSFK